MVYLGIFAAPSSRFQVWCNLWRNPGLAYVLWGSTNRRSNRSSVDNFFAWLYDSLCRERDIRVIEDNSGGYVGNTKFNWMIYIFVESEVSTLNIFYFIFYEVPQVFQVWQRLCERDALGFHRPPPTASRDDGFEVFSANRYLRRDLSSMLSPCIWTLNQPLSNFTIWLGVFVKGKYPKPHSIFLCIY